MSEPRTIYRITLRALSSDTTPTNRLKRLLKVALRQFRFQCVGIETLTEDKPDPNHATIGKTANDVIR